MSACKYTERISAAECIGDSLSKINQNFQNLDYGLCGKATPKPGHATSVTSQVTELGDAIYKINALNSYVYKTTFDSLQVATQSPVSLKDGTPLTITTFPYVGTLASAKPIATFTSVALTDKAPTVSLYWLASGVSAPLTTFNLNSASPTDKGQTWFNGTVTSLLKTGTNLYVGGTFTTVGSALAEKISRINLTSSAGTFDPTNPITNLGSHGEVREIVEHTITYSGSPRTYLIVGGSFESPGIRGKGLLIYDTTNNIFHHFYVNGEVNAIKVRNGTVMVGGSFDYVNTGTASASTFSGKRVYSNGLFTVSLGGLAAGLTTAALSDASSIFEPRATINSIEYYASGSLFYVGGEFKVRETVDKLKCQNVCCIRFSGSSYVLYEAWRPIVNGPVYKVYIDDNISTGDSAYLYIAGEFSEVYSQTQFYLTPRIKDDFNTKFYNAFAVKLTDLATLRTTPLTINDWKPKFNGPVTNLLAHSNIASSHIYCYGKQTTVNDESVNYLVAVTKASSPVRGEVVSNWRPSLQNSPSLLNNALIRGTNGLIVGGNFTEANTFKRYNLAEIADTTSAVTSLSNVVWDFGAQPISIGSSLSFNTSSIYTERVSAVPFAYDNINVTSFTVPEDTFRGLHGGQMIRYTVKRPGNSSAIGLLPATNETFRQDVYVVGYKVDFN
jgi:hypothetical protein